MSDFDRRSFLRLGLGSLAAAAATQWFAPPWAMATDPPSSRAGKAPKAKAVIVLWMNGGPSHIDTFDPKPGQKSAGSFKAIKTRTPGLEISEHLPKLAEQSHRYTVVRSLTSKEGNHQRAKYLLHTGYAPNPTVVHPTLGAYASSQLGKSGDLPSFVNVSAPGLSPGFLGSEHGAFLVSNPSQLPANVARPFLVDETRESKRLAGLMALEDGFSAETGEIKVRGHRAMIDNATALMNSQNLKAFDLSSEAAKTRAAYGETDFGRGCLMARRLVESGVKFVEVVLDGWDTHQDGPERIKKLSNTMDPAMAALLDDLATRKLLDSTLVVWMGDFGRTPAINGNEGRDHHPQAGSMLLAGGGIRPGRVFGSTDKEGDKVVDKPVLVPNLFATIATQLGLDPAKEFTSPLGRPISLTDQGFPIAELIG
jgi:hypothetical protein